MQTRRDLVQAYRFQARRAIAALVTGRPNVAEPPMRRLTVTTISGIMIAILVAAAVALFGLLRPPTDESGARPTSLPQRVLPLIAASPGLDPAAMRLPSPG